MCKAIDGLQVHHIYPGAKRQMSDKYGATVALCHRHHTGKEGVHFNKSFDTYLKEAYQHKFEETHTREQFISIFGRSYL